MGKDYPASAKEIPDEAMSYIRKLAVHAVRERGISPEIVAIAFDVNRTCIYRWLNQYDEGGYKTLESHMAPGAEPIITPRIDVWMKQTVLESTPDKHGYDTNLWTGKILAELLKDKFGIDVSDSAVRLHLKAMGLSCQKPEYQDELRDEKEIKNFLEVKFPKIQQLAEKLGADIAFEDEAGVGVTTRHGRTWGERGDTPIVPVSMLRGGYNVLSIVTVKGELVYSIKDGKINGERFIEFLGEVIKNRDNPLILLADHASFHKSKLVRDFVRANRTKIRLFFLPKRAPEFNPDEQVWNEIKNNRIGKQPVKSKLDLGFRLKDALESLKNNTQRVISFFNMPDTKYAGGCVA